VRLSPAKAKAGERLSYLLGKLKAGRHRLTAPIARVGALAPAEL
jgi:hypothetical protein